MNELQKATGRMVGWLLLVLCLGTQAQWASARRAAIEVPTKKTRTISQAMLLAASGDTIWVAKGTYHERIIVKPGVVLYCRDQFNAVINGGGRGTVVTLSKNAKICGFTIKNGTIGVMSKETGTVITNNRIIGNWSSGLMCTGNLPQIRDNIISFNRGSGIMAYDVKGTVNTINHNSVMYNGNHGISLGGKCSIVIENNIIAYNERFGIKTPSAAKSVQLMRNDFWSNLRNADLGLSGNFVLDPQLEAPRSKLNFNLRRSSPLFAKGTDSGNLGARMTF
jgi:hypothetical protein